MAFIYKYLVSLMFIPSIEVIKGDDVGRRKHDCGSGNAGFFREDEPVNIARPK
jgi:hypothetical protein